LGVTFNFLSVILGVILGVIAALYGRVGTVRFRGLQSGFIGSSPRHPLLKLSKVRDLGVKNVQNPKITSKRPFDQFPYRR